MRATGVIVAVLDCDADAIEDWNRWYDLEHTPPNLALEGVQGGRRYVATPALHRLRSGSAEAFTGGRGTFLTVYTLTGEPQAAFDAMVELREQLVARQAMFADEKKAVRSGDVWALCSASADPTLRVVPDDVAFIGHGALSVIERQGEQGANEAAGQAFGTRVVEVPGVLAHLGFVSLTRPQMALDLLLLEGDPAEVTARRRSEAPHLDQAGVRADATYRLIDPLRYPFADEIRRSWLPPTVTSQPRTAP